MIRKGEITPAIIRRKWPHRVELSAEAVRGAENSAATFGLAKELSGAPYPLSDFHDDRHFAVFHFKTAEHAATFCKRFGGVLLPVAGTRRRWRPGGLGKRGYQ
jgi:hypothetical protein